MYSDRQISKIKDILDMQKVMTIPKKVLTKYTVELVKDDIKGTGLVAMHNFKEGDGVAYYKLYIAKQRPLPATRKDTNQYAVGLKTKSDAASVYMGDISPSSLPKAHSSSNAGHKYLIPYWAYFANEPTTLDGWNVFLDTEPEYNFASTERLGYVRQHLKPGAYVRYRLVATETIRKGDPIAWCYGLGYLRYLDNDPSKPQYETPCSKKGAYADETPKPKAII